MHAHRLTANPPELVRILDRLRSVVQVALTARRESHSGLVSCLKEAQRGHPHRWKQCEPPDLRRANPEQDAGNEQRRAEGHEAEAQAVALTAGTDVGGWGDGYGLVSCLRKQRI